MNTLDRVGATRAKGDIRCIDVGKIWAEGTDRALQALVDIDLEVAPGEFIVLLGPSGCGKSTLLYLVSGLETPSSGRIECDGMEVSEPSSDRSLIFQESSLYPWLSVADNVTFGIIATLGQHLPHVLPQVPVLRDRPSGVVFRWDPRNLDEP